MVSTSTPLTCLNMDRICDNSIKKLLGFSSRLLFKPSKLQHFNDLIINQNKFDLHQYS